MFDYICSFPLYWGKSYQQAFRSADSDGTTCLPCLVPLHLPLRWDAEPACFYSSASFLATIVVEFINVVHFAQRRGLKSSLISVKKIHLIIIVINSIGRILIAIKKNKQWWRPIARTKTAITKLLLINCCKQQHPGNYTCSISNN